MMQVSPRIVSSPLHWETLCWPPANASGRETVGHLFCGRLSSFGRRSSHAPSQRHKIRKPKRCCKNTKHCVPATRIWRCIALTGPTHSRKPSSVQPKKVGRSSWSSFTPNTATYHPATVELRQRRSGGPLSSIRQWWNHSNLSS